MIDQSFQDIIYPDEGSGQYCDYQLEGYKGSMHLFPFKVPQDSEDYSNFVELIEEEKY